MIGGMALADENYQWDNYEKYLSDDAAPKKKKPTQGRCSQCQSRELDFFDEGSGKCRTCGRVFWWDKSRKPADWDEQQASSAVGAQGQQYAQNYDTSEDYSQGQYQDQGQQAYDQGQEHYQQDGQDYYQQDDQGYSKEEANLFAADNQEGAGLQGQGQDKTAANTSSQGEDIDSILEANLPEDEDLALLEQMKRLGMLLKEERISKDEFDERMDSLKLEFGA